MCLFRESLRAAKPKGRLDMLVVVASLRQVRCPQSSGVDSPARGIRVKVLRVHVFEEGVECRGGMVVVAKETKSLKANLWGIDSSGTRKIPFRGWNEVDHRPALNNRATC